LWLSQETFSPAVSHDATQKTARIASEITLFRIEAAAEKQDTRKLFSRFRFRPGHCASESIPRRGCRPSNSNEMQRAWLRDISPIHACYSQWRKSTMKKAMPFLGASLTLLAASWSTVAKAQDAKPFQDVPTTHWAYEAVTDLQSKGIIIGYPSGFFIGKRDNHASILPRRVTPVKCEYRQA